MLSEPPDNEVVESFKLSLIKESLRKTSIISAHTPEKDCVYAYHGVIVRSADYDQPKPSLRRSRRAMS